MQDTISVAYLICQGIFGSIINSKCVREKICGDSLGMNIRGNLLILKLNEESLSFETEHYGFTYKGLGEEYGYKRRKAN